MRFSTVSENEDEPVQKSLGKSEEFVIAGRGNRVIAALGRIGYGDDVVKAELSGTRDDTFDFSPVPLLGRCRLWQQRNETEDFKTSKVGREMGRRCGRGKDLRRGHVGLKTWIQNTVGEGKLEEKRN